MAQGKEKREAVMPDKIIINVSFGITKRISRLNDLAPFGWAGDV